MLPKHTFLNGLEVNWDTGFAEAPITFAHGWSFRVRKHGDLALWEFRAGDKPIHRAIVNGCRDLLATPLKLRTVEQPRAWDTVSVEEIDLLGSLEGHLWSDEAALAFLAPYNGDHPFDAHFQADAPFADVKVTKDTGSGGVERFLAEGLVCLKHGASAAAYRWFAAYAAIQFRRPRCVVRNGLPDGLDGMVVPPIEGFHEWMLDKELVHNPGDAQHADCDELYWAWRLFRDPLFLVALIQFWMTARWQFGAWRNPKASKELYAGSVRTPALLLKATAFLLDAIRDIPALAQLRQQAEAFALQNLDIVTDHWPIYTMSGSVPPEIRDEDGQVRPHTKPWMDSLLALGLQYLGRVFVRMYGPTSTYACRCHAQAERILDWLDAECWDAERGRFCAVLAKDGTKQWVPLNLGTSLWPSSALHWSPKAGRGIADAMRTFLADIGAYEPASKHHLGWVVGGVPMYLEDYDTGFETEGDGQ